MKMNRHAFIAIMVTLFLTILFFTSYYFHNKLAGPTGEPNVFTSIFYLLIFILPLAIIYTIIALIAAAHKETKPEESKDKNKTYGEVD